MQTSPVFAGGDVRGSFIDIDYGHDNHKQKYRRHSSVQAEANLRFLPVTQCFSHRYSCSMISLIYIKYRHTMGMVYLQHHVDKFAAVVAHALVLAISRKGREELGFNWHQTKGKKKQKMGRCSNFAEIRQMPSLLWMLIKPQSHSADSPSKVIQM